MDIVTIGQVIRNTRKALHLRQDQLASVAGVSVRTLSEIENGKESARIALVLKVLESLGIEIRLEPPVDAGSDSRAPRS